MQYEMLRDYHPISSATSSDKSFRFLGQTLWPKDRRFDPSTSGWHLSPPESLVWDVYIVSGSLFSATLPLVK